LLTEILKKDKMFMDVYTGKINEVKVR